MTLITNTEIRHKQISLRSTFTTALRSVDHLDVIEFVINGIHVGQTVATPAITGDSHDAIIRDLSAIELEGREISDFDQFNSELQRYTITQSAKAAIDMALYSMLHGDFPSCRVKSDVTIPIAPISEYPRLIEARKDFAALKIKLDKAPLEDALEKIATVRELCPDKHIRIDPNQSWTLDDSISFINAMEEIDVVIDYLEQPTPRADFTALRELRRSGSIPIMADESCFTQVDLDRLIDLEAIDYVNLKILKNGGMTEVLALADRARAAGIAVSIGSMMEGGIGIRAAAHLASIIAPSAIHDLDAAWWHAESSATYRDGFIVT